MRNAQHTSWAVSVPSSSGHVFRPTNTGYQSAATNTFQSPLHRGMCFDGDVQRRARSGKLGFSPLFIGACVSTRIFQHVAEMTESFQSPLHRGMCFDTADIVEGLKLSACFSPLF